MKFVGILAVALASVACSEDKEQPATEVIVEIESDLGESLRAIDVDVRDSNDHETSSGYRFKLGDDLSPPFTFAVVPRKTLDATFVVVATGRDGGGKPIAEAKVKARFAPRETLGPLELLLSVACAGVTNCPDGFTCDSEALAAASSDPDQACHRIPSAKLMQYDSKRHITGDLPDTGVDANSDAETGDAGPIQGDAGSASPLGGVAIAKAGEPCAPELERACSAHNSRDKLVCSHHEWSPDLTPCEGDTRCDTVLGQDQGTCQPVAILCAGKEPGDDICDGSVRKRCTIDLLSYEAHDCTEHAHCDGKKAVECKCDDGFEDDGHGGCANIDDCKDDPCGPHASACKDEVSGYSCTCRDGFSGTGTSECTDIDECSLNAGVCGDGGDCSNVVGGYVCSCPQGYSSSKGSAPTCVDFDACASSSVVCPKDYPCEDRPAPSLEYDCRGQFAGWKAQDSPNSFTVHADGTVDDTRNDLTWQRNLPTTYAGCSGKLSAQGDACTWTEATVYCDGLALAGGHWRLPTKAELESIVDFTFTGETDTSVIDSAVFPGTPNTGFWTASPYKPTSGNSWVVDFMDGHSTSRASATMLSVRCVRSSMPVTASAGNGATRPGHYVDNGGDTVYDNDTKLLWQQTTGTDIYPMGQGVMSCINRGPGWRMPSVSELLTLVDPTRSNPAMDPVLFPLPQPNDIVNDDCYWTSSSIAPMGYPFAVNFSDGSTGTYTSGDQECHVRCVQ